MPKKCLLLTLSYLPVLSLQTGTKLKKSLKVILNCRKLHKSQNKLSNAFRFKGYILQELKTGDIYKFNIWMLSWWMCNGHVRIEEIIRILPLTKKILSRKGYVVSDYLLLWKYSLSFDRVLMKENRKVLLELKKSILIMTDKPSFNLNIKSVPLQLLNRV